MNIAFLVPTTSKGHNWEKITDTYFCKYLIDSCNKTLTDKYNYMFYIGIDNDDDFLKNSDFNVVGITYKLIKFEGIKKGHLTKMWNILYKQAYDDGCEYFVQCGDDVEFLNYGWLDDCISVLDKNNNIGVCGPIDINNTRLLTQTVVSRSHMNIFGLFFPEEITNWYCDDWINDVYKAVGKFFVIQKFCNNRGGKERYDIDYEGRNVLKSLLNRSINTFLDRTISGKHIISFSLWGTSPKYTIGAIRNAVLANDIYPGWICRFYIGRSVPEEIINILRSMNNTELVLMEEEGDWTSMFWRFLPTTESDVDVMISRDTDSRLSLREKHAVNEWLLSDKGVHIMRDHPWHNTLILGGMWGIKGGTLPCFKNLLHSFIKTNNYDTDQSFLRSVIYPLINSNCLVHDEFFEKKPFPTLRTNYEFVGEVYDEFDIRDPNHWKLLNI